jgi:hypothetical protein
MGLKGYRLWDMGQLDSTCRAPPFARRLFHARFSSLMIAVVSSKPPMRRRYKLTHVKAKA